MIREVGADCRHICLETNTRDLSLRHEVSEHFVYANNQFLDHNRTEHIYRFRSRIPLAPPRHLKIRIIIRRGLRKGGGETTMMLENERATKGENRTRRENEPGSAPPTRSLFYEYSNTRQ